MDSFMPCAVKSSIINGLQISLLRSIIQKLVSALEIGDHFFLNLNLGFWVPNKVDEGQTKRSQLHLLWLSSTRWSLWVWLTLCRVGSG